LDGKYIFAIDSKQQFLIIDAFNRENITIRTLDHITDITVLSLTIAQINYTTIAVASLNRMVGMPMERAQPFIFFLSGDFTSPRAHIKVELHPLQYNGMFGDHGNFKEPSFKFHYIKER